VLERRLSFQIRCSDDITLDVFSFVQDFVMMVAVIMMMMMMQAQCGVTMSDAILAYIGCYLDFKVGSS